MCRTIILCLLSILSIIITFESEANAQFVKPATVPYSAGVFYIGGSDSTYQLDWTPNPANGLEGDPRRWTYGLKKVAISRDFEIGQYEISRFDYAQMLNYADSLGWVSISGGVVYNEVGTKMALLNLQNPVSGNSKDPSPSANQISYSGSSYIVDIGTEQTALANVSYYGAVFYCFVLNRKFNYDLLYDTITWEANVYGLTGYRLPTEAEWTRVSRGLNNTRDFMWDGVSQSSTSFFNANTNFISSGYRDPITVGEYPAQGENNDVYDLGANVAEWVSDFKDPYYHRYKSWHPLNSEGGDNFDGRRITLGGSHDCPAHYFRNTYHWTHYPSAMDDRIGFRVG